MARILFTDMGGNEQSVTIHSGEPKISIGRAVDCHIRSNRKSVSRHHAEIILQNGQFEVLDLNSSNGTFLMINDQRRPIIGKEYITHNDEIWCGDFVLRFLDDSRGMAPELEKRPPIPTLNTPANSWSPQSPTFPPEDANKGVGVEKSGMEPLTADLENLERLMAEKSSIEDLASRQALEIDRLENLLTNNENEQSQDSAIELNAAIQELENEKKSLQDKLKNSDLTLDALEKEVADLHALNTQLGQDSEERKMSVNLELEGELEVKNIEIEDLLAQTNLGASKNLALEETISTLNREVERLTQQLADNDLQSSAGTQIEIAELKQELLSCTQTQKEQLNSSEERYKSEEKEKKMLAKQLMNLKKEKDQMTEELQKAKKALDGAKKNSSAKRKSSQSVVYDDALIDFLSSLERFVDAIDRADLMPLSTVDRVRLQSAIRETKPKETLRNFLAKQK